jgi:hypothetical protein
MKIEVLGLVQCSFEYLDLGVWICFNVI